MRKVILAALLLPAALAAPAAFAQPAPARPAGPAPAARPSSAWSQYPRLQLERTFAGPLQDTVIQRWRDPESGVVCYLYLPITAQHSAPLANGFVQYGPNAIGSISCAVEGTRPPGR
ncbi:hypothetical protein ACO2Q3_14025 [Caulobacter sp. KR2-114]|uniref:hypothetical protein n=1 Tax=Caulobacter sp. KR2-114 TaxID=3400912 RepID=UPI003C05F72F